eukprot:CAMPEP_0174292462 /NCGR_PEP_ID=MMETSP0809-20121228/35595_1 /TAXON_ID=73025 ORGANISM="Eutreptiella gymnastica-like, Strain CCMP1594" /NCGR_SAMPLE_ID=MMETSP0809 /ASSEMBLY_ACC=CAM_ASM_000658 /LENGTH=315 /DNA_ID=CAMNT_0015392559 /DNA_START=40 /DNA_END=987 /DNA_ORIENTATION=-
MWQWVTDEGRWHCYDEHSNAAILRAEAQGMAKVFLKIGPHDTEVKFKKGHQKNMRTGKKRKVRKVAVHECTPSCRPVVFMRTQSCPGSSATFRAVPQDPLMNQYMRPVGYQGASGPAGPGQMARRMIQLDADGFPIYDPALFDPPAAPAAPESRPLTNLPVDAEGFPIYNPALFDAIPNQDQDLMSRRPPAAPAQGRQSPPAPSPNVAPPRIPPPPAGQPRTAPPKAADVPKGPAPASADDSSDSEDESEDYAQAKRLVRTQSEPTPVYSADMSQGPVYSSEMSSTPVYSSDMSDGPVYSASMSNCPVYSSGMHA